MTSWTGSRVSPGKMDDVVEEMPPETYKVLPQQLDIYDCIEDMAKHPFRANQRLKTIEDAIERLVLQGRLDSLLAASEDNNRRGETVLHTAIRLFQFRSNEEKSVVEALVTKFPKLLLQDRSNTEYFGQTPLHMAVCKGNIWLVSTLLKQLSRKETKHWKMTLFKRTANGRIFTNTVMLGELPLSIAALTFNKGMFDLLLNEGAELDGTNTFGDTVCHSLVRYGHLYPDKLDDVLNMLRKIVEDPAPYETGARAERLRKLRKKIWLMENLEGLNPLQLAASLGLHRVFCFIMDQEAYCFENSKDGLFDIKIYDVTEVDAISSMTSAELKGLNNNAPFESTPENLPRRNVADEYKPYRKSILMILLDLDPAVAFQFILFPPIRRIVNQKWNAYRKVFYPLWVFHSVFMFFLTWYCIERSKQRPNTTGNATGFDINGVPAFEKRIPSDAFITAYGVISIVVSLLYILQDVFRMINGRMPWTLNSFWNPYSNGWFRLMFLLFGVCLIIDFFLAIWIDRYENYLLILAMIDGWFLTIFFLRPIRPFSFFTVLIQKILIVDLFKFFVILGIEILAFATAMHMAIQGSDSSVDDSFHNFWRVLFSMFNLMIGVGDQVSIYNTRHPVLCIIIFIGFVVMTTLLMVNALIAMMGRTCMELVEDVGNVRSHDRHWKLQMLSVILFLESISPKSIIFKVGIPQEVRRYNNNIRRRKQMKRYMLEVRSLQSEDDDDEEGQVTSTWGLRTAVVNELKNQGSPKKERPLSGISDKIRDFFNRRERKGNKRKKLAKDDEYDRAVPDEHRPTQIQPPVSHVFGLNPMAAHNGYPNGGFVRMDSRPAEIDIYHISSCRKCSVSDVTSVGRQRRHSIDDSSLNDHEP